MSAVSSVMTPGVLVTVMPRRSALVTSMWSTPLPKLAISRICIARLGDHGGVDVVGDRRHEDVGLAHGLDDLGLRHRLVFELRRASNSSRMRVSTSSGSRRVTTTTGFFLVMNAALSAQPAPFSPRPRSQTFASTPSSGLRLINAVRSKWSHAGVLPAACAAGSPASLPEGRANTRMASPPSRNPR